MAGLMDSFAVAISMCLQYGVPLEVLCAKFSHTRFEPSGWTGIPEIGYAKSIMDYIFRWLASQFLGEEDKQELGILTASERARLESLYSGVQPELIPAPVVPIAQVLPGPAAVGRDALSSATERTATPFVLREIEGRTSPSPTTVLAPTNGGSVYKGPRVQTDAPTCASCGWIMSRSGTCYRCENCGSTSGCS